MLRGLGRTRLAAALFGVLLIGSEASARNEQLQWTHANPSTVDGFRVYWRASGSSTQNQVDAGLPAVQGSTYTFTVANVPDASDVYFSVRAFNAGGDSPSSNEICRGPGVPCGSTPPPPPPPPPPPGGTQASISSFKLWNATTDQVIDSNFQSGETVTANCAAIEIIGNSYLTSGGGSLRKAFSNGVSSCENTAPFAWEDDAGVGQFNCAVSLTNGSHTLTVTPYDGENCSGTAGTPVSINFSVNAGTPPPPPPAAIGTPGKPYLVQ